VGINDWVRSASKATDFCSCCWWKQRKGPFAAIRSFVPSICIAAMRNQKEYESGGGAQLDVAQAEGISGGRFDREQLAGAPGRRKLDRRVDWALSSRLVPGFG
jgi:hypothetical protein